MKLGTLDLKALKRAVKFASRDKSSPTLMAVHLDRCGDVVATDAYRLYVEHGAWEGEEVNLEIGFAREVAKLKGATAEVWSDGGASIVARADREVRGSAVRNKYPDYTTVLKGLETRAVAYVGKQVKPVLDEHKRMKQKVRFDVADRDLHVSGIGIAQPTLSVEKACDGADVSIGFDPAFIGSALAAVGWNARVAVTSAVKPGVVWPLDNQRIEIVVMPVRIDEAKKAKQAPKSAEPEIGGSMEGLKGKHVCITGVLAGMTRSEAFIRLRAVGGVPCENFTKKTEVLVVGAKSGKGKRQKADKAIADGQKVEVVDGTTFVQALRKAEQEMEEAMAKKVEQKAKEKAGAEAKATVKQVGTGVTAITIEPPKHPKAPKKEQIQAQAMEVSLKAMQAWCEGKNAVATQKRDGCPIWVEGDTKPYQAELKELGFRWAPKRKGWYFPAAR